MGSKTPDYEADGKNHGTFGPALCPSHALGMSSNLIKVARPTQVSPTMQVVSLEVRTRLETETAALGMAEATMIATAKGASQHWPP